MIEWLFQLEMEASRENGLIDYWCIQYQKLLDSKPSTLIMRENNLESGVMKILCRSGAEQYIPTFARHCVVTKNLAYLTEDDLQKVTTDRHNLVLMLV
jgi:E3 ubiquitin-protein ligase LRSAM1